MKKRLILPLTCALLGPGFSASAADEGTDLVQSDHAVVYGTDDRQEFYQVTDPAIQQLARQSIALITRDEYVVDYGNGSVELRGNPLPVCPGHAFRGQPISGECSATLIDSQTVLTAGHCVTSAYDCMNQRFVFNRYYDAEGQLHALTPNDVYRCGQVVARHLDDLKNNPGLPGIDYAVVRLDRPVASHLKPAKVLVQRPLYARGTPLRLLGFPNGIPLKVDSNAWVENSDTVSAFYKAVMDSFAGNSGSGVFNAQLELVGVLVRGSEDYETDQYNQCWNPVQLSDARGEEQVNYIQPALKAMCDSGYQSPICQGSTQGNPGGSTQGNPGEFCPNGNCWGTGGGSGDGSGQPTVSDEGGCTCTGAQGPETSPWALVAIGLFALLFRRRRA